MQFPEIRLKILEHNNVILLQCADLEPETFMPAIIDGRLSIINILPQRRCRCINTSFIVAKETKNCNNTTATTQQKSLDASGNFSNSSDLQASTPDQMRHNVVAPPSIKRQALFQQWSKTRKSLQFGIVEHSNDLSKENQILNDQTIGQISICRVEPLGENSANSLTIPKGNLSNMEWPLIEASENFSFLSPKLKALPKWPERWRTPNRTYSKQKYTPARISEKVRKCSFISPTEGVKSETHITQLEPKKNKKVIDKKIKISPRSFKNQFQYKKAFESYIELKIEHNERENEVAKKTVYELFTTPAMQSNFSHKLQKQFRDRCTNKAQSTYPKYKKLATF